MNDDLNQRKTQNLYEAAFCLCQGLKLAGKEEVRNKITVIFEGKAAQKTAMTFYNGAKVEAQAYAAAYRTLKDFIFER